MKADIGSIIGYALSAIDYDEGRRKSRGDVALNLNSDSLPTDESAISAEHLEIEFQDQSTHYYVKVIIVLNYLNKQIRLILRKGSVF